MENQLFEVRPSSVFVTTDTTTCQNLHSECEHWGMRGNCLHYREYMLANCGLACGVCPSPGESESHVFRWFRFKLCLFSQPIEAKM